VIYRANQGKRVDLVIGAYRAYPGPMTPEQLRARTKKFAVDSVRLGALVPRGPVSDRIATQLTDAASSGAAAYRSACRARSRADFIYKLGNSIEEIDEAAFWLEVLCESGILPDSTTKPMWTEADELTRILVRSRETARSNHQSRNHR
jgi:four helix bundle protein